MSTDGDGCGAVAPLADSDFSLKGIPFPFTG